MFDPRQIRRRPVEPASQAIYTHSRSRTTSSNTFPSVPAQAPPPMPPLQHQQAQMQVHLQQPPVPQHNRRSPSVNTFSTVSSGGMGPPPAAYRTSPNPTQADLRRSISSRSGSTSQPTSYVALLRKQKATVWCDRAQYEDPRLAQQRAVAKQRAYLEVAGSGAGGYSGGSGRTSTGLSSAGGKVAAKIRHHGKQSVVGYAPESNYIGVGGVPLRLSAAEVEGEDSDDDDLSTQKLHHRRTGSSGRSSTASANRRTMTYRTSGSGLNPSGSLSSGRRWSPGDTPERSGSMVEDTLGASADASSGSRETPAAGNSAEDAERADAVPELGAPAGKLASNSSAHATVTRERSVKSADDLRRRGSVDERTMSLNTTGRLFIANPD